MSKGALAILADGKTYTAQENGGAEELALRAWIGTDESGKGDFFGPLVVAGFFTTHERAAVLSERGVCDSKKLSSSRIRDIASRLRSSFADSIAIVAPSNRKYNELYAQFQNLNRLLAWCHARAIQNLLEVHGGADGAEVDGVVADQFGDERYIRNALKSMQSVHLIQRPRAESNPAVAAASILARDYFERRMEALSAQYWMVLPLGAGERVTSAARAFSEKHGKAALMDVAKVHFKTYKEI